MVGVLAQLVERLVRKEFRIFSLIFPCLDSLGQSKFHHCFVKNWRDSLGHGCPENFLYG